jgi:murein DD-endopeptidase MepM/ murein hydrolase activator NlpD
MRFDEESQRFVDYAPDRTKNEHFFVYGMRVYAIADGEVIICWRNAPENDPPGATHPARAETPPRIFGGGNFLFIEHTNGDVALYAHFQPGTIPAEICPNIDEFHPDAGNDWNAAVSGPRPQVRRGDFLGEVGNAGASGGPHLHISLHQGTLAGASAGGPAVAMPFDAFRHKSSNLTRDLASDWAAETNDVLPPGPIVILPSPADPQYRPAAWVGKTWGEFLTQWQAFERQGYRLHDFETYVEGGRRLYAGIFKQGTSRPAAWIGKPWDEFLAQWQAFERQGYRLHDFETYTDSGRQLYAGVFVPGTYAPAAWIGKPWDEFLARWQELEREGYRLHDFETYVSGGQRLYAGIFVPGTYPPAAWIGKPWAEFLDQWQELERQGYRLHDFETYVVGGQRLYAGVFVPGTYPPAAWMGKPWDEFLMKWGQFENVNYRMHDLEIYEGERTLLYGGIFEGPPARSLRRLDQRLPSPTRRRQ